MTPNELYAMEPEKRSKDLGILIGFYYNHVPELADFMNDISGIENERAEIRYLKYFCFDGRRVWILASVWFDDKPVMIIQNAGREGDDHHARYVTDGKLYEDMIRYLRGLLKVEKENEDLANPDADIADLTTFYGNSLFGQFKYY